MVSSRVEAHPVFTMIAREIGCVDGELQLSEERFEFWVKRCWTKYPRNAHSALYRQLGALAFELAPRRCLAALQLFALATLGLDMVRAERLSREERFLSSDEATRTRSVAGAMAAAGVLPPLRPAPAPTPMQATPSTTTRTMPMVFATSGKVTPYAITSGTSGVRTRPGSAQSHMHRASGPRTVAEARALAEARGGAERRASRSLSAEAAPTAGTKRRASTTRNAAEATAAVAAATPEPSNEDPPMSQPTRPVELDAEATARAEPLPLQAILAALQSAPLGVISTASARLFEDYERGEPAAASSVLRSLAEVALLPAARAARVVIERTSPRTLAELTAAG